MVWKESATACQDTANLFRFQVPVARPAVEMKKRLITVALPAAFALCVGTALAQDEKATPTATPEASATATSAPSASATPSATPESSATPEGTPEATASSSAPETSPSNTAEASPSPSDNLPEPSDLGADAHPDDSTLPSGESSNPSDLPNPDSLMPNDASEGVAPPPPKVAENKFEKQRSTEIRYQEVKLQALKEAAIRDMHAKADVAGTDEAKRQALREYYRMLFAKMVSIDPSLKDKCDAMLQAYLRRLGQYRVEPSIPLQPPPTPEPLALAEPSATPKAKKKTQAN
jgi:hypothetical protein